MGTLPNSDLILPFFNLTTVTPSTLSIAIYLGLCLLFLSHWIIASYHWHTYGSEQRISRLSIAVYGFSGALLLIIMGLLLATS